MKSKSKLGLGRINKATLDRIRDLREVLVFLEAHPRSTKWDIEKKFGWSPSKCSKVLNSLIKCELAKLVGTSGGKGPSNLYSALPHTEEDLDRELPLDLERSQTSGRPSDEKPNPHVVREWVAGEATRDPLIVALMGSGVAPSLTFKYRQTVSGGINFIDSAKGE